MSFVEVYHIVSSASHSPDPASEMSRLSDIKIEDLTESEIALLYGLVTKDMPCLSSYLPSEKRILGMLMSCHAIPTRIHQWD